MTKLPDSNPQSNVRQGPAGGGSASIVGEHSLGAATGELRSQHPQKHDDLGPHHGGMEHMRHMPLHGLKGK